MPISEKRARARARELVSDELSYQQALDKVAQDNGFDNWSAAKKRLFPDRSAFLVQR